MTRFRQTGGAEGAGWLQPHRGAASVCRPQVNVVGHLPTDLTATTSLSKKCAEAVKVHASVSRKGRAENLVTTMARTRQVAKYPEVKGQSPQPPYR